MPTLCVRICPPVSRRGVPGVLGMCRAPGENPDQLAAAAGVEDVLADDVLVEEELDEEAAGADSEVLDFESLFALSLAVLPLRESVR